MALIKLLAQLQPHVDDSGQVLLGHLVETLGHYDWRLAADLLRNDLENNQGENSLELLDSLLESLRRFYDPLEPQKAAFKTDLRNLDHYVRYFTQHGRLDGALAIMDMFPHLFNPLGKTMCGAIRTRCVRAAHQGCPGQFVGELRQVMVCPECDTPRRLCKGKAMSNGRCKLHRGAMSTAGFSGAYQNGRANAYLGNIQKGRLRKLFIQAVEDKDYLRLHPELALLSTRVAELLDQMGGMDFEKLRGHLKGKTNDLRKATLMGDQPAIEDATRQIVMLIDQGAEDTGRWREIANLTDRIGNLADKERKRLETEQAQITAAEMMELLLETQQMIKLGIAQAARQITLDYVKEVKQFLGLERGRELEKALMADPMIASGEMLSRRIMGQLSELFREGDYDEARRSRREALAAPAAHIIEATTDDYEPTDQQYEDPE